MLISALLLFFPRTAQIYIAAVQRSHKSSDQTGCSVPAAISWPLGVDHSITVHPIVPEDAPLTREFFDSLSADSRYNRFFGTGITLSPLGFRISIHEGSRELRCAVLEL